MRLWRTSDAGHHWTALHDPPDDQQGSCDVSVSQTDANLLVVEVAQGIQPGTAYTQDFASTDGGHRWLTLTPNQRFMALAGHGAAVYALRIPDTTSRTAGPALGMSADSLRSWRPIGGAITAIHAAVGGLWLDGATGSLLVAVGTHQALWLSTDEGTHWRMLSTPFTGGPVVETQPDGTWALCGAIAMGATPAPSYCTFDGGQHWQRLPHLSATISCATCDKGKPMTVTETGTLCGITPDGSPLAILGYALDNQGTASALYRLPPGASTWQSLGPLPGSGSGWLWVVARGPVWLRDESGTGSNDYYTASIVPATG